MYQFQQVSFIQNQSGLWGSMVSGFDPSHPPKKTEYVLNPLEKLQLKEMATLPFLFLYFHYLIPNSD